MSGIDTLPPLREVIAAHGLSAKKALGQNFLLDLNLTSKIARVAGDLTGADVLEIGPGPGGLTRGLLASGARRVVAVEKDARCLPAPDQIAAAYPDRLVNIHPSLLPSFRGVDAVGQALDAGVRLAGCTVHLVCEEVDSGRILIQAAVPVLDGDDRASLAARIQVQEHRILPLGVAIAAQRLRGRTAAGGAQWRPAAPPSG